jgi:hypothetical protein
MSGLGDFQLGTTTTVLGGSNAAGGETDTLSGSPSGSTPSTSTTAGAQPTTATATTEPSDSTSEGISGNVTALTGNSPTATTFTTTTGGAVLTVTISPTEGIGFETKVTAFGVVQSLLGSGTTSDPFTEATAKKELEVGDFTLGEQTLGEEEFLTTTLSTETIGDSLAEGFGGDVTTMESETFEADSFSEGINGDITTLSMADILADSLSQANADAGINTLTLTPLQAIRYLPDWAVYPGPKVIQTVNEEVRTFREMTLTWVMKREDLVDILRPEIDDAGKLEVVDRIDGGFDVVTRGENNDIRLAAPTDHADVRPIEDYFVQEFEETPLGTDAERWEIELTVSPEIEKAYDNQYGTLSSAPSKSRSSGQWLFEFAFGDVATRRVTSDVTKAPDGSVDSVELSLVLEPEEVRVIEESVSKLAATNFVDVPDGSGYIDDESDNDRNTVTVTPPSAATDTVEAADYIVTEWETTWTRNRSHTVELVLKQP